MFLSPVACLPWPQPSCLCRGRIFLLMRIFSTFTFMFFLCLLLHCFHFSYFYEYGGHVGVYFVWFFLCFLIQSCFFFFWGFSFRTKSHYLWLENFCRKNIHFFSLQTIHMKILSRFSSHTISIQTSVEHQYRLHLYLVAFLLCRIDNFDNSHSSLSQLSWRII